jgi:hypothetical protein
MSLIKQEFYFTENTKRVTLRPSAQKKTTQILLYSMHMSIKNRIVIMIQPGKKLYSSIT